MNVSEFIFREDEVVAGVKVAVVLEDTGMAAGSGQGADSGLSSHPVSEGGVEKLDEDFSDIFFHPFVEDFT